MTGALRAADHASEPNALPPSVGVFAAVVEDLDRRLRAIDDSKLDLFWAWETYDEEGVRFGILRTTEQVGGHQHRARPVARLRSRDVARTTEAGQDLGHLRHDARRPEHTQMQHQRSLGRCLDGSVT